MKIKCSKKTIIVLLSVVGVMIVLYTLTFFFGIREVRLGNEFELHSCYNDLKVFLGENKIPISEIKNPFWKKIMEANKPFPTWEEFKEHCEEVLNIKRFVIFPFLIKSESEDCEEFHLWHISGELLLKRKILFYY